jgi:hypothetical protein
MTTPTMTMREWLETGRRIGWPHFGQAAASGETAFPQAGHFVRAGISEPSRTSLNLHRLDVAVAKVHVTDTGEDELLRSVFLPAAVHRYGLVVRRGSTS